jgi:hypothetical protein
LVCTELDGYPPDIVRRAVSDALRAAQAVVLRDYQEGTAGSGRGGLPALLKYLRKLLRGTADDMMRGQDTCEAQNRTEQVVHREMLNRRVEAIRGNTARRGTDAVMNAVFGSEE